ncbi:hypothetical protein ONZ45_g19112 [Pleurotus djamor]|nr:hypothetical protein ONZ45_g19112 [Pleurotus djamor]
MPVTFTSIWAPPTLIPFTWTESSSTTVINSLPSASSSWSTSSSLTTRATTTWTIPSSPPSSQPLETSESVGLQSTLSSTSTTTSASPGVNVSNPSSSLSTHWKIAGSVIGAVIGGSVFFAVILVLRHRRRRQQSASSAVYSRMSDGYDGTGQYGSPRRGGMGLPTMAEITPAMITHPLPASDALEVDRLLMNGGLSPRASQTDLTSDGSAFFQARPPMPPIRTDGGDYYNSSKNVTSVSLQPSRLSIPESYYVRHFYVFLVSAYLTVIDASRILKLSRALQLQSLPSCGIRLRRRLKIIRVIPVTLPSRNLRTLLIPPDLGLSIGGGKVVYSLRR